MDDDAPSSPAANTFGATAVHATAAAIATAIPRRVAGRRRKRGARACSGNTFIVTSYREAGMAGGYRHGANRVPRAIHRMGARHGDQTPFHPTRCKFFGASMGGFARKTPGMPIAEPGRNGARRARPRPPEQHHAENCVDQ
jgi:hypothetical protein